MLHHQFPCWRISNVHKFGASPPVWDCSARQKNDRTISPATTKILDPFLCNFKNRKHMIFTHYIPFLLIISMGNWSKSSSLTSSPHAFSICRVGRPVWRWKKKQLWYDLIICSNALALRKTTTFSRRSSAPSGSGSSILVWWFDPCHPPGGAVNTAYNVQLQWDLMGFYDGLMGFNGI